MWTSVALIRARLPTCPCTSHFRRLAAAAAGDLEVNPFSAVASGDTEKVAVLLNHYTEGFVHPTLPKTSQWTTGPVHSITRLETYPQKTLNGLLRHAVQCKVPAGMIDDLLSSGADPAAFSSDEFGTNAVHIASHSQQADIMDMLLTDAHRTARGHSPEIPFRNAGRQVRVKNETFSLVDARRLSPDGSTALWEAAFNGDLDSCRVLLECGANPNLRRELFVVFFIRTPSISTASAHAEQKTVTLRSCSLFSLCLFFPSDSLQLPPTPSLD
jgi:hypothetical protein